MNSICNSLAISEPMFQLSRRVPGGHLQENVDCTQCPPKPTSCSGYRGSSCRACTPRTLAGPIV